MPLFHPSVLQCDLLLSGREELPDLCTRTAGVVVQNQVYEADALEEQRRNPFHAHSSLLWPTPLPSRDPGGKSRWTGEFP